MNDNTYSFEIHPINMDEVNLDPQIIIKNIKKESLLRLNEYLFDNLSIKDGGPVINDLKIQNFKYNKLKEIGSFRLNFRIDRRYCCSDVETCTNDYVDFEFYKNKNSLIAKTIYFEWELDN